MVKFKADDGREVLRTVYDGLMFDSYKMAIKLQPAENLKRYKNVIASMNKQLEKLNVDNSDK